MEIMANDPDSVAEMLVAWETEIGKTMPKDFKDWWQNSPSEWPLVARLVIESLRERESLAWEMLANACQQAPNPEPENDSRK